MFEEDDEDHDEDTPPFVALFQQQLDEATPDQAMGTPMSFDAQIKTLGERMTAITHLIEQHRREMQPTGVPDQMVDVSTWNLYQTAFHLAVRDL